MFQRLVYGALGASVMLRGVAGAQQFLAPTQDINLPASETATNPLEWLGANSPWFAGELTSFSPEMGLSDLRQSLC
jgi:acid phosphatase